MDWCCGSSNAVDAPVCRGEGEGTELKSKALILPVNLRSYSYL